MNTYRIERFDPHVQRWLVLCYARGAKLATVECRHAAQLWEARCRAINDDTQTVLIHAGIVQADAVRQ